MGITSNNLFGSGVSAFIDGEAANYAALPSAASNAGKVYLVLASSGVWLINRKSGGLYLSDGVVWSIIIDYDTLVTQISTNTTNIALKQDKIQFKDEGVDVGLSGQVVSVNFVGAGVSASYSSGSMTVTIAGGSGSGDMLAANNLSDVASISTARNNILPSKTGNTLKVLRVNAAETDYELATISGGGSGDSGTVVFDFGSAPGTNVVTTAVSSATISAGSKVELYLMGTDSTATHNTIEHQMLPLLGLSLTPISISAGVGFTAQAMSNARLTGTFTARWVWSD